MTEYKEKVTHLYQRIHMELDQELYISLNLLSHLTYYLTKQCQWFINIARMKVVNIY